MHFEHQYFSNSLNAWITVNDAETLAEATVDYPLEGVRNRTVLVLGEQEDTEQKGCTMFLLKFAAEKMYVYYMNNVWM